MSLFFQQLSKGELDRKGRITEKGAARLATCSAMLNTSGNHVTFWSQVVCDWLWYAIMAGRKFLLKRKAWEGCG